jgi:PAS domain S-box-containing protein
MAKKYAQESGDLEGKPIFDILPAILSEQRKYCIDRAIQYGEVSHYEDNQDGRFFINHIYPIVDISGTVTRVAVFALDITEHRKDEEAVRLNEARYRSLIETQSDIIARSDLEGRLTFVNDAYCRTFGRSREELIGWIFTPSVFQEDLDITNASQQTLLAPPHRTQTETRNITPSGPRWFAWENSAILDEQGTVIELQGIGRDITLRKQTEDLRISTCRMSFAPL